jgi:hypothetical protein
MSPRGVRRERSRSERREPSLSEPVPVRWIVTARKNHSLLVVNADQVPKEMLQHALAVANSVFGCTVRENITEFPYHLDGGWPEIDPHDDFVMYAQIETGQYAGTSAMATGSPKATRERGVALALVVAAATELADPKEMLEQFLHHEELSAWVGQAKLQRERLEAALDASTSACPITAGQHTEHGGGRHTDRGDRSLELEVEMLRDKLRVADLDRAEARAIWEDARAQVRRCDDTVDRLREQLRQAEDRLQEHDGGRSSSRSSRPSAAGTSRRR